MSPAVQEQTPSLISTHSLSSQKKEILKESPLEHIAEQKQYFVNAWALSFFIGNSLLTLYIVAYFHEWSLLGKLFTIALLLVYLAGALYYFKFRMLGQPVLFRALMFNLASLNLVIAMFTNDEHDIILEEETMADFIYHNFVIAMPVIYLMMVKSILVTLEVIQTQKQRRLFFFGFTALYVLQFFLPIKVKVAEAFEHFDFMFQVVVPILLFLAMCGFTYIFFRLSNTSA
mmetsp:Transcript_2746/g.4305  ORF Transcript_2746/g.4305 Transcript_2746/m.4305 type:complete len:230 (+) Transcript_2746:374-1063(+)